QTVLWTVLVAAAFATLLLGAIYQRKDAIEVLKKDLRPDLLALMGISYASAVGAGLVQSTKSTKEADPKAADKSKKINGSIADDAHGVLYCNKSAKDAAFTDMFEGDEVADAHLVDMAKVQMFFFTIVSAAYFISQMAAELIKHGFEAAAI